MVGPALRGSCPTSESELFVLFNLFSRRKKLDSTLRRPAVEPESPLVAEPATDVEGTTVAPQTAAPDPVAHALVASPAQGNEITSDTIVAEISGTARVSDAESAIESAPSAGTAPDETVPDEIREPIADPEPDVLDLTTLTVPVLRQRAREAGLTGYSRMKKSELIVALAATRDE